MSAWCSDNVLPQVNLRGICKQYVKHDVPVYVCMNEQACVCVCVCVLRENKKNQTVPVTPQWSVGLQNIQNS